MEMSGEQLIAAPQKEVWDALNDPQILKAVEIIPSAAKIPIVAFEPKAGKKGSADADAKASAPPVDEP